MAPEEPQIVLTTPRWAGFGTIALFAACAIAIARSQVHRAGYGYAIAICVAFVLVGIVGLIERPRLEIAGGVLTDVALLRRKSFDLRRCSRFHARQLRLRGGRWVITFDYEADGVPSRRRRRPNSYVDTHGHDGDEVARLLNHARDVARRTGT